IVGLVQFDRLTARDCWIRCALGELLFTFKSSAFSWRCWIVGLLDCWIRCAAAFGGVGLLD
ncbi:MAG: hypothetical protein AB8B56_21880, partial [Crocinitomicaceae bacterium]